MTGPLHDDEIPIDLALVRALVDRALPDFASLELRPLGASGSTNALFRLGDELVVRLPRQPGGSANIEKEARWLPKIEPHLPVRVPSVVAVGEPDLSYPERWSVVRWIPGAVPGVVGPDPTADPTRRLLADDLVGVITALGGIGVPAEAVNDPELHWYRGDPLERMDADTRRNLDDCRSIPGLDLDLDAALRTWDQAMALPGVDSQVSPRWYHGDLLAENLLVRDGRLVAVLDFGGLAVGDPTVDLVPAWEVLDAPARDAFREAIDVDDAAWLRGRAWALAIAAMTFPYYWSTMPARCAGRLAMARAVVADAA